MKSHLMALGAFLVLTLAGTAPVMADARSPDSQDGAWVKDGPVEARLVASVTGTGDLATLPIGLDLRLEPGWKTYWRSPGDAGFAPRLDWSGSHNLKSAELGYPAPYRFSILGFETAGYDTAVMLPISATPEQPGQPVNLRLSAELLVCSTVCIPQTVTLALDLPAGEATPAPSANDIARAQAAIPTDGRVAGLEVVRVGTEGRILEVELVGRETLISPDIFVETAPPVPFVQPERQFSDDDRRVVLRLAYPQSIDLAGRPLTLTITDGVRAAEVKVVAEPGLASAPQGLWAMIALALLGGLILNLMPCVLPVLSLKLLSVIKQGGKSPGSLRAGFLASAAGIITSFLLLAGGLLLVKAAGGMVGWGIQFQQPLFLGFMTLLVTLFAANLWGLFEVPLPRGLADRLSGGTAGDGNSIAGNFATGMFATLLATPCSAPFLGTAVGFALARGPVEVLAIFAALGVGLAAPYLLVALFPALARILPRPGRWMITLRHILGGALLLTALWLLSVLTAQLGSAGVVVVASLLGLVLLVLLLGRTLGKTLVRGLVTVLALASLAVPMLWQPPQREAGVTTAKGSWVPFDQSAIATQVSAGRVVFVDVTADWCITCQANKRLVLDGGVIAARLADTGTLMAMQADWTRPDEGIARYLASYGRYGIPFNIVYGPGAPAGIILPELLTEAAVLDALNRAGGSDASASALAGQAGRG